METRIPEKSKKNGKARNSNKKPYSIRPDKFKPQGIPNTELKFQSQNSIPTSQIRIHKIWAPLFCHPNWKVHMWEYQGGGVLVF